MDRHVRFFFSPKGRVSRSEIWLRVQIPLTLLALIGLVMDALLFPNLGVRGYFPITYGLLLLAVWPMVIVGIKRGHDRSVSAKWIIGFLVLHIASLGLIIFGSVSPQPFILVLGVMPLPIFLGLAVGCTNALYAFALLYCLPGEMGENAYGANPLEAAQSPGPSPTVFEDPFP